MVSVLVPVTFLIAVIRISNKKQPREERFPKAYSQGIQAMMAGKACCHEGDKADHDASSQEVE